MMPLVQRAMSFGPLLTLVLACTSCSNSSKSQPHAEAVRPTPLTQASPASRTPENPPSARAAITVAPPLGVAPADAQLPDRILRSGHTNTVDAVAFSPDHRWLASGSYDKTIRIWDLSTGRTLQTLTAHTDDVWSLSFSPDGRRLVSASQDGTARVWDTNTGAPLYTLTPRGIPTGATFSPDGQFLVLACESKDEEGGGAFFEIHDAVSGSKLREIALDWSRPYPLVVTPDGRIFSSGGRGEDGDLDVATKVWDLKTGQELKHLPIPALGISSDGRWIASVNFQPQGAKVTLYDASTGKSIRTIVAPDRYIGHLTFTPDGTRLLAALGNGSVSGTGSAIGIWDTATGKEIAGLPSDKSDVHALAVSPDGKYFATANHNGHSTKIWDLATASAVRTLEGNPFSGYLAFDRDSRLLVSEPAGLCMWDIAKGEEIGIIPGVAGGTLAFSGDGNWLASNPQGSVKIWSTKTWSAANLTPSQSAYVWWMGFAGAQLPPSIATSGVRSWKIEEAALAPALVGSTYAMALSQEGKFLAVGHARGGDVEIWDVTTATKLTTFSAHKLSVNKLEFSPDGRFLLTTGQETPTTPAMINAHQLTVESGVKLWSVNTWSIQASLSFTGMGLGGAEFNADGRLLALTNGPGIIELFDINQAKTVRKLASGAYAGGNMAFSPDGNWLALFSQQGIVVWNLAAARPL